MASPAPPKRAPVEAKVQAGTAAATVAGALIWVLQQYVFKHNIDPGLVSLIYAAVPGALAFAAAWLAPHTPRPAAAVAAQPSNVTVTGRPAGGI